MAMWGNVDSVHITEYIWSTAALVCCIHRRCTLKMQTSCVCGEVHTEALYITSASAYRPGCRTQIKLQVCWMENAVKTVKRVYISQVRSWVGGRSACVIGKILMSQKSWREPGQLHFLIWTSLLNYYGEPGRWLQGLSPLSILWAENMEKGK